jgi:hypothetical protein
VLTRSAQALYSLSQDNPSFRTAILRHPTALPSLVALAREDHADAEIQSRNSGKGRSKRKEKEVEGNEIGDGRALLMRLLVCGESRSDLPFVRSPRTDVVFVGVLRNVVKPGSAADEAVDLRDLTNEVVLPLINGLLDIKPDAVAERVMQFVAQVVSFISQTQASLYSGTRPAPLMCCCSPSKGR